MSSTPNTSVRLRTEDGQTTIEFAFMLVMGLLIVTGLLGALGFIPDYVVDALQGALAGS